MADTAETTSLRLPEGAPPPPGERRRALLALLLCVIFVGGVAVAGLTLVLRRDPGSNPSAGGAPSGSGTAAYQWPERGQGALVVEGRAGAASPGEKPVPIASVAKVMTAYLVLRAEPLEADGDGPRLTVSADDVADTAIRRQRDESVVKVREGEVLTERQALEALLLPSANNVAVMLARQVSGSIDAFVARMNATARDIGMRHTTYTDPSGFDPATVSTAADQVLLAQEAMHDSTFASLVRMRSAHLPVAGTVHNTDTLIDKDGFVGIKTGSHDAAGGCFMFRAYRVASGQTVAITGVVLGQRGHNLIQAALQAADRLADQVSTETPRP